MHILKLSLFWLSAVFTSGTCEFDTVLIRNDTVLILCIAHGHAKTGILEITLRPPDRVVALYHISGEEPELTGAMALACDFIRADVDRIEEQGQPAQQPRK